MSRILERMRPVNRHLLIIPHTKKKEQTRGGVLLPDGFDDTPGRYSVVTVVDAASDCSKDFKRFSLERYTETIDRKAVVETSMIEEIEVNDKKHHLILENYVVGIIESPS